MRPQNQNERGEGQRNMTEYMKFREWVDASGGPGSVGNYSTKMEYLLNKAAKQNKSNPGWSLYLAMETEEL